MALRSNGPVMLALPPFRGFTRWIILVAGGAYLAVVVLGFVVPRFTAELMGLLALRPALVARGMIWEPVTYPLVGMGLLSVLFALVTVWFFGSRVEDDCGARWFAEYFWTATIGGGLLAVLLSFLLGRWVPGVGPLTALGAGGLWPASLAILLAFARFHAEEEIRFNFIFRLKAKVLVAIYVGFYIFLALFSGDRFGALLALCNALCGYGFLQLAPRQGLRFALSERWFEMRNARIRAKRKDAAKKFEVYMRKQGKDVRVEDEPNDKWMN
jgi:membrane associated rhomboid family serine protease